MGQPHPVKILLIGGYGGFGARIARRLAMSGHQILVAGRSLARAEAFCAGKPGLRPLALDLRAGLEKLLAAERPDALVDAAGPFQKSDYRVAKAAIAAGCHYLDIADGRGFVAGIGALDEVARAAEVAVVSGASSVPALSGAAVRLLAPGMEDVRAVEIAISASNRATAGPSVARAILSYVGRPVQVWRGGRWTTAQGWHELERIDFETPGEPPVARRLVALADVPDLELLPERLPGRPAVSFKAGTELALHNRALRLLAWAVRRGWLPSAERLAPLLLAGQRLTAGVGSDRSAMSVRMFGIAGGARVERRWTLVASKGDGPEIPALSVPVLLEWLAEGKLAPGARDAGALLDLVDFEPAFAELAIRHSVLELPQPPPLYQRVMGTAFHTLPSAVRRMHEVLRDGGASGGAMVLRGRGPAARLVARAMRFPPSGEHPLHVHFAERDGAESWTRDFGGHYFTSRLEQAGALMVERFGPMRFTFALLGDRNGLSMAMKSWRVGPLPMPLALAPRAYGREWEEDGRFRFEVRLALPLIGPIIRYAGWLEVPSR